MINRILVIAKNTFRETIRDRVLYGILGFALFYILFTIFLGKLSLGDMVMIRSFGLAGVYLFSLIATIFLGSSILYKEIERRTLYFVLSKPVSRFEVVIGKFFGLAGAVSLTMILMAIVYLVVVGFQGGGFDGSGLLAIALQIVEMSLFVALLICLSSVAAPLTSTLCALMLLATGHLLEVMLRNAEQIGGFVEVVARCAYYLLPNLEKFNIRNTVVHDIALTPEIGVITIAYGLLYIIFLLTIAATLFEKREL